MAQPSFGIRIRMLRLRKGLSQWELAERCGLSDDQIGKIERGKSWTGELSLALLAHWLGVPQGSLFDYSENDSFIKSGGLHQRSGRKSAHLGVTRKKQVLIRVARKKRRD
jgi:transcriptional regulator with XRE-family HTH domain